LIAFIPSLHWVKCYLIYRIRTSFRRDISITKVEGEKERILVISPNPDAETHSPKWDKINMPLKNESKQHPWSQRKCKSKPVKIPPHSC
jgi:hypothetical protein